MNKNTDTFTGPSSFTDPFIRVGDDCIGGALDVWILLAASARRVYQRRRVDHQPASSYSGRQLHPCLFYVYPVRNEPAKETGSGYSDSSEAWRVGGLYDLFLGQRCLPIMPRPSCRMHATQPQRRNSDIQSSYWRPSGGRREGVDQQSREPDGRTLPNHHEQQGRT